MQKKKKILQKFFGPSSNLKRFQAPPFFKISKVNPLEKHVDSNFNGQGLGGHSLSEVTGMCLLQVKSRGLSGKMCTLQNMGSFSKQPE